MELQKAIIIKNTPAKIEVNFDEVRALMEKELERFNYVVTADGVADARKMAAELNKIKKHISDRRKEEIKKASVEISQFDEQMKDLEIQAEKARKDLTDQIDRYDDERRDLCRDLLGKARDWLFEQYEIEPKFQRAEFEDLVKVTGVTDKDNLTKAIKQDLEARVRDDKALQDRTVRRVLELENQCYRAGMKAPLTQEHVKAFLFDSDEVYQRELDSLIARELERQEEAEKRIRADMEKEQARKQQEEQAKATARRYNYEPGTQGAARPETSEPASQPQEGESVEAWRDRMEDNIAARKLAANQHAQPDPESPPESDKPRPAAKGKVAVTVTCQFDIEVPASLREDQIEAELRRVMGKAGLAKTLTAIYIKKNNQEAA